MAERFRNIIKNPQAIANTVGVFFVTTCAAQNYRVSVAWEQREKIYKSTLREIEKLRSLGNDENWIESVEKQIRSSPKDNDVLKRAIAARLKSDVIESNSHMLNSSMTPTVDWDILQRSVIDKSLNEINSEIKSQ